jgi:probable rRNA maturation factor
MVDAKPTLGRRPLTGGDGVPEVFCVDEQDDPPVDLERWRALALGALASCGVRGGAELSLAFVDIATMTQLNGRFMGKVGPTDVLAFPLEESVPDRAPGPGQITSGPSRPEPSGSDAPLLLGDVIVCPAVAREQAPVHAGTLDDELALLVVHGILHVLGHDHDTDATAAGMQHRERAILEEHHWRGPAPERFRAEVQR